MKVSRNWLQEYLDFELPETTELVERIGAQLGAVEAVTDLAEQYRGIVIVKIISCEKLENSDHLNRCMVDDGGMTPDVERDNAGLVQVITGAPNVRAAMYVAWLPPGSVVPSSYGKEPFVMEARMLRGALSNGMLASAKELAIGDSHEGILELDFDEKSVLKTSDEVTPADALNNSVALPSIKPGDDFAITYGLNDVMIDLENKMFTHRPDCFGILGVAREVAGILGQPFSSPLVYRIPKTRSEIAVSGRLTVRNELPNLVPRYMVQIFDDIVVRPSPLALQVYLSRVGIRPINNIVDITNYFMVLTGQPMHAYDYDKVKAQDPESDSATLVIRNPFPQEKLLLLNGKEIEPRSEAILISTETSAIGLAGVMGGQTTEVDDQTTTIILECATFDMYSIRRSSMAHGVFSDAVTRFNKGQSPLQNDRIMAWATDMVSAVTGATAAGTIDDTQLDEAVIARDSLYLPVQVSTTFINDRLGLSLEAEAMATLLRNVEFAVGVEADELTVTLPFWRTDIELREDIVEEVGRLYGFDKLPLVLPTRSLEPAQKDSLLELKQRIRSSLARLGANEVLSYSFVNGSLLDSVTQSRDQAFKLSNALSPELQYYRLHALPSLLDKIHMNSKAGYDEFALFELNKGHNLIHSHDEDDGVPPEFEFLDFVYTSSKKLPGAAFYRARRYLDALAKDFGLTLSYAPVNEDPHVPVADPYDLQRSAYVSIAGGEFLGMVGELKSSILKKLKLPAQTAAFTIGPTILGDALITNHYQQLPKFPRVEQDICLRVAADLGYQELLDFVISEVTNHKPEQSVLSVSPLDIYQREDDTEYKQVTFRISIASYLKTLTDQEMSSILTTLDIATQQKFAASRV
jgi:phenylalanyl-tRNA synthetase beta chain